VLRRKSTHGLGDYQKSMVQLGHDGNWDGMEFNSVGVCAGRALYSKRSMERLDWATKQLEITTNIPSPDAKL
jgi:hypothetical protein